jgi:hypothetical protein
MRFSIPVAGCLAQEFVRLATTVQWPRRVANWYIATSAGELAMTWESAGSVEYSAQRHVISVGNRISEDEHNPIICPTLSPRKLGRELGLQGKRLFYEAGFNECIRKGDTVAVKTHVGEWNGTRYLRPGLLAAMVDEVKAVGRQQGATAQLRHHFSRGNSNCRNSAALVPASVTASG